MSPDNDWYGHKRILADYCGLSRPQAIFGYLHHGWDVDWSQGGGTRRVRQAPILVWNRRHLEQARSAGAENVVRVGAPFAYLAKLLASHGSAPGRGTIFFPIHTADGTSYSVSAADSLAAIENECQPPFTISIYYQDLGSELAEEAKERGWRLVSFGSRSDALFLYRLHSELLAHSTVVANAPQSAIWYGGLLARRILIRGDRPKRGVSKSASDVADRERDSMNLYRRWEAMWPDLFGDGLSGLDATSVAAIELGADSLLSPADLRRQLGWSSPVKVALARGIGLLSDLKVGGQVRRGELPQGE